jgi:hypothetical protein
MNMTAEVKMPEGPALADLSFLQKNFEILFKSVSAFGRLNRFLLIEEATRSPRTGGGQWTSPRSISTTKTPVSEPLSTGFIPKGCAAHAAWPETIFVYAGDTRPAGFQTIAAPAADTNRMPGPEHFSKASGIRRATCGESCLQTLSENPQAGWPKILIASAGLFLDFERAYGGW